VPGKPFHSGFPGDDRAQSNAQHHRGAGVHLPAAGGGGQAGSAGIGSLWLWDLRRLDKDQKPVPPVTHVSEIVIREVLPVPGGATLLALGMLRDLTAGRIDVWDLGKDKRETMKDTKKGA